MWEVLIQNKDQMLCIHGNVSRTCEKCLTQKNIFVLKDNDNKKICEEILCIHGRRHNTCGNCIRRANEKMKRKVTKSNRTVNNCDNFCEHFESVELCKECTKNIKFSISSWTLFLSTKTLSSLLLCFESSNDLTNLLPFLEPLDALGLEFTIFFVIFFWVMLSNLYNWL